MLIWVNSSYLCDYAVQWTPGIRGSLSEHDHYLE